MGLFPNDCYALQIYNKKKFPAIFCREKLKIRKYYLQLCGLQRFTPLGNITSSGSIDLLNFDS